MCYRESLELYCTIELRKCINCFDSNKKQDKFITTINIIDDDHEMFFSVSL